MGAWIKDEYTVVRILKIEDIEVSIINDGCEPPKSHFIGIGVSG